MEYKPANNSYSNYEKHIHNETKKNISETDKEIMRQKIEKQVNEAKNNR